MEFAPYFGLVGILGLATFLSIFFIVRLFKVKRELKAQKVSLNKENPEEPSIKKKKILAELNEIDTEFQIKIKTIERHLEAL